MHQLLDMAVRCMCARVEVLLLFWCHSLRSSLRCVEGEEGVRRGSLEERLVRGALVHVKETALSRQLARALAWPRQLPHTQPTSLTRT